MSKRKIVVKGGTIIFDDGQIGIMLRSARGEVGKDVQRRAYAVQKRMKRLVKVVTGELRNGIRVESVRESPQGPASRVVSDAPHTLVNELGRGPVHATGRASATKIRSNQTQTTGGLRWGSDPSTGSRSGWLRFANRSGNIVFFRDVPGAEGSGFMEKSIDAAID